MLPEGVFTKLPANKELLQKKQKELNAAKDFQAILKHGGVGVSLRKWRQKTVQEKKEEKAPEKEEDNDTAWLVENLGRMPCYQDRALQRRQGEMLDAAVAAQAVESVKESKMSLPSKQAPRPGRVEMLLNTLPTLRHLKKDELESIARSLTYQRYGPFTTVLEQDVPVKNIFLVLQGNLEATSMEFEHCWLVSTGDFFGQEAALNPQDVKSRQFRQPIRIASGEEPAEIGVIGALSKHRVSVCRPLLCCTERHKTS
ncbi:hypothetical protein CYMTET_11804 [Cymbomonas tetramitiformis]|uniref:Cyclic nucleotide-binding domain-containing protein n=1 Tax=Cymbomonas tetramitiformis TaxID=36881 RepID=A0AAE0GLU4_9CHLO|nr:hypothetical protein CYMTET_11804 [Cymbomonas tetramitiformis]